jgi:hypothetical protein
MEEEAGEEVKSTWESFARKVEVKVWEGVGGGGRYGRERLMLQGCDCRQNNWPGLAPGRFIGQPLGAPTSSTSPTCPWPAGKWIGILRHGSQTFWTEHWKYSRLHFYLISSIAIFQAQFSDDGPRLLLLNLMVMTDEIHLFLFWNMPDEKNSLSYVNLMPLLLPLTAALHDHWPCVFNRSVWFADGRMPHLIVLVPQHGHLKLSYVL